MKRALAVPLALVAAVSVSSARADEVPTTTYVVQAGDTCDRIAAKLFGDPKRIDLIHRFNPQLGPVPHNLQPGTTLTVPTSADADPDARLGYVRNHVNVEAPTPRPGHPNDPLFRGNRVATEEASSAGVRFRDATQIYLGEKTLVVILGDTSGAVSRSASLANGKLRARLGALAGKSSSMPVATPSADVRLGPGESQVTVDPAKATRLAVYAGQSQIAARRASVDVPAGFGSKAESGKAPTPPRPLPPAPEWTVAPPPLVLGEGALGDIVAEYRAGTGVGPAPASWHAQVARDADFEDLLVDESVPLSVIRLEAKRLPPGPYFVRVSAVDADEFEGPYGKASRAIVAQWESAPAGERHAALTVTPAGLRCGIDDGPRAPWTGPIEVETLHPHRLRCSPADSDVVAEQSVPPERLGIQVADVTLASVDHAARHAEVRFTVRDAHGRSIGDVPLAVTASPGITVSPARRDDVRGLVAVPIAWEHGVRVATLSVAANGDDRATLPPVALDGPARGGPLEGEPCEDTRAGELTLAVGFAGATPARPTVSGTVGAQARLGAAELSVGFRTGYEPLAQAHDSARAEDGFTLAVPIAVRLPLEPDRRWVPSLGVAPMLAYRASGGSSLEGFVLSEGIERRLGPGGVVAELGFRWLGGTSSGRFASDGATSGVVGSVGYRLAW